MHLHEPAHHGFLALLLMGSYSPRNKIYNNKSNAPSNGITKKINGKEKKVSK
jgi:hypothetical protein